MLALFARYCTFLVILRNIVTLNIGQGHDTCTTFAMVLFDEEYQPLQKSYLSIFR